LLEQARNQADGLVADGAIGNEDRSIDCISQATREDLRAIDLEGDTMAAIGRSTVEARSHCADAARGRALSQRS
jgi:hypothetical protein